MTNMPQPVQQNLTPKEPDSVQARLGDVNIPSSGQLRTIEKTVYHSHSGPLPPASELAAYDKIKPDLVERILCMAEANAENERAQVKSEQKSYFWLNLLGRVFGFVFALSALGATVGLCLTGHDKVGGSIGVAAVAGTVAALISGKIVKTENSK